MNKIKMLRGLPASGKTTLARLLVRESGNAGRANRDDLRAMLFDSVWSGKREAVVIEIEKAIAHILLKHGLTPIIDDTNLTEKHKNMWSEMARQEGAAFETVLLDADRGECLWRDRQRGKQVGPAIINKMALIARYPVFRDDLPLVIVDIDGTLANGEVRQRHLLGEHKDWKAYYSELSNDTPIDLVVRWVKELYKNHNIAIVSGRPDTYQFETEDWLSQHGIPYDALLMRGNADRRDDTVVKKEILDLLPKERIAFVIDDRPRVVRMWKENGLRVIPVAGQCEEF